MMQITIEKPALDYLNKKQHDTLTLILRKASAG